MAEGTSGLHPTRDGETFINGAPGFPGPPELWRDPGPRYGGGGSQESHPKSDDGACLTWGTLVGGDKWRAVYIPLMTVRLS
jgi:hypothetical protein